MPQCLIGADCSGLEAAHTGQPQASDNQLLEWEARRGSFQGYRCSLKGDSGGLYKDCRRNPGVVLAVHGVSLT